MGEELYNVVTLDNGVEYTEVSRLDHNGETFIFLCDVENPNNYCIKKVVTEDDTEYIEAVDSKQQYDELFKLFTNKMMN